MSNDIPQTTEEAEQLKNSLSAIGKSARSVAGDDKGIFSGLIQSIENVDISTEEGRQKLLEYGNTLKNNIRDSLSSTKTDFESLKTEFLNLGNSTGITEPQLNAFLNILKEMGIISAEVPASLANAGNTMEGLKPHIASTSEAIMSFSGALMQANAFINSMTSLGDVFSDEDATTIEKLGAVVGVLTSAFMMFNAVSKLTTTLMALQTGASKATMQSTG